MYDAGDEISAQDAYDRFEECLKTAGAASVQKAKRRRYEWVSSHTEEIRKLRDEAKIRSSRCRTASAESRWHQLVKETPRHLKIIGLSTMRVFVMMLQ